MAVRPLWAGSGGCHGNRGRGDARAGTAGEPSSPTVSQQVVELGPVGQQGGGGEGVCTRFRMASLPDRVPAPRRSTGQAHGPLGAEPAG